MANYIDGFVFPLAKNHLTEYQRIAEQVAEIWKEHGALAYCEFVGDDLNMEGTLSFIQALGAKENETIIFGWVTFISKEVRDLANHRVATDPRMSELVGPLMNPSRMIFDASRMAFGGFKSFIT